jgi:hypothetical protein
MSCSNIMQLFTYFFLCLFFLKRFLRLWVDILCLFFFFPLGIIVFLNDYFTFFFTLLTKLLAGLKEGMKCSGMMMVVFLEMFLPVF